MKHSFSFRSLILSIIFLLRVWADQVLQYSEYFPLGAVYGVDNTCRMPFQIVNLGFEIGLCGSGGTDPEQMGDATLPANLRTPDNIRTLAVKTVQP